VGKVIGGNYGQWWLIALLLFDTKKKGGPILEGKRLHGLVPNNRRGVTDQREVGRAEDGKKFDGDNHVGGGKGGGQI